MTSIHAAPAAVPPNRYYGTRDVLVEIGRCYEDPLGSSGVPEAVTSKSMAESFLEKIPEVGGLVRFDPDVEVDVETDVEVEVCIEAEIEVESEDGEPAGAIVEIAPTFGKIPSASSARFRARREV